MTEKSFSVYTRPPGSRKKRTHYDDDESEISLAVRSRIRSGRPAEQDIESEKRTASILAKREAREEALRILSDQHVLEAEEKELIEALVQQTATTLEIPKSTVARVFSKSMVMNQVSHRQKTLTITISP